MKSLLQVLAVLFGILALLTGCGLVSLVVSRAVRQGWLLPLVLLTVFVLSVAAFFAVLNRESQLAERERSADEQVTLRRLRAMMPEEYGRTMMALLRRRGYQVEVAPPPADQGVDLILTQDGRRIAVRTKPWKKEVSVRVVQAVFAGMHYHRADETWVIAPSAFTQSAAGCATKLGVRLVNSDELDRWLQEAENRETTHLHSGRDDSVERL